jgi:hypothetical protein
MKKTTITFIIASLIALTLVVALVAAQNFRDNSKPAAPF